VWLSKTQGWVTEVNEDMKRGSFLEDGIARWYCERYGIAERMVEPGTIRHATRPFAICTPDRIVGRRLLSIKVPRRKTAAWGDPGTDNVPAAYLLQLQWEFAVLDALGDSGLDDEMHLAALLDGELAVYIIRADKELQRDLLNYAEQWWKRHVVGGEQPSMDGSERATAWLKSRFPKDNGKARDAMPHEIRLMVELEMAEQELDRAEQQFDDLANQLRESMGDTWRLDAPNGYVTWKTDKRGVKTFKTKFTNKEKHHG
jgi:predicted phage-related endonuclease